MTTEHPTILLVDDDLSVLDALYELFCDDYHALTAAVGADAIALVRSNSSIRAVVLDMRMANMDGVVTYKGIKEARAHLPIIIHTGNPAEYARRLDGMSPPFAIVAKSRSISDLVTAVRTACSQFPAASSTNA